MTAQSIGQGVVQAIAAGIEAATPEAQTAAALAAGKITQRMADQFEADLRAVEQAERMADRIGDTLVSAIERQHDKVVKAMQDLLSKAEDAFDDHLKSIRDQFSKEDLVERISDAERELERKRAELAEANRAAKGAPAAAAALAAAQRAQEQDSPELLAARKRVTDAEDALFRAKLGGVSDTGYFSDEANAAKRALSEIEKAEQARESKAVQDAQKAFDEAQRALESLKDLPEAVSDSERALKRAYLDMFMRMAGDGITPMGWGAAQTEMRKYGELAGLSHEQMLDVAKKAVDIGNAQNRADGAAAGRLSNDQVQSITDGVVAAIKQAFPTALAIDGALIRNAITSYLAGGTAP